MLTNGNEMAETARSTVTSQTAKAKKSKMTVDRVEETKPDATKREGRNQVKRV